MVADIELADIHGVARMEPAGEPGGRAPAVDAVTGGTTSVRGPCVAFGPRPVPATPTPSSS